MCTKARGVFFVICFFSLFFVAATGTRHERIHTANTHNAFTHLRSASGTLHPERSTRSERSSRSSRHTADSTAYASPSTTVFSCYLTTRTTTRASRSDQLRRRCFAPSLGGFSQGRPPMPVHHHKTRGLSLDDTAAKTKKVFALMPSEPRQVIYEQVSES